MALEPPIIWKVDQPFTLESGTTLPELEIAYHAYGQLSAAGDNVIWICHALTGNSDAMDWWSGMVGEDKLLDPRRYFIVCANILGSCYGTTGSGSVDPSTGEAYRQHFPLVTIRDMVGAHELLRRHLGIEQIYLAIGGSMGGQQVLEWAVQSPNLFKYLILLATNARHSPWGIAFNESQRMAIYADQTLYDNTPQAGQKGLETARAIAMLSYRAYGTYLHTQLDPDDGKMEEFRASTYQRYQGWKLWNRFNVFAYLTLSKAMDSHNLARNRGSLESVLARIMAKTLVVGIESDILFPISEQKFLAAHIPGAELTLLDSLYGHDGFLIEFAEIEARIQKFMAGNLNGLAHPQLQGNLQKPWNSASPINKSALPGSERF